MGFWFFMVCTNLSIPLLMLAFGARFQKKPPTDINGVFGYRTTRSMQSQAAWDFAQRYFGKLWFRFGLILLPLSIAPMFFVLGKSTDTIGTFGGVLCFLLCACMLFPILPVERALKQKFGQEKK